MGRFLSENYGKNGRWADRALLLLSVWAVHVLVWVPRTDLIPNLVRNCLVSAAVLLVLPGRLIPGGERRRPEAWEAAVCALISAEFFFRFYAGWIAQRRLLGIIGRLGMWWTAIVSLTALLGIAFSLILQGRLLRLVRLFRERAEAAARAGEASVGPVPMRAVKYLLIAGIAVLHFYIMQYSMLAFPQITFGMSWQYLLLNLALYITAEVLIVLVVQRWRVAMLISSVLFALWGVANHYVYMLHGSPLYPAELANTGAAMGVLSQYRITAGEIPWAVLGLIALNFAVLRTLRAVDTQCRTFGWREITARLILAALLLLPADLALVKNTPRFGGGVPTYYVAHYGFACCAAADEVRALNPVLVPDGYSADRLPQAQAVSAETDARLPDIIMILNESFCDLQYYADVTPDRDVLADFYSIDGAYYGRAASTVIGGGTNNSEYELLTGFPYYLVTSYAPFNYLNFSRINANVVEYLERLGYATAGMHPYSRSIYNRGSAYPALGFDRVTLGPTDSLPRTYYGLRTNLDSSYYEVLKEEYNALPEDSPRFVYMLTMQNHGGYSQNDPEYDTVHIAENLGALTEQTDEFLSCLALSVEAFRDLTEYYASVDRPVIICMVGDHAPVLIKNLPSTRFTSSDEASLAQRIVPYVLWSNCGYDFSGCAEYVNIFGLMPQLIRLAGLPVTPFYRAIADMEADFPILINSGLVMNADGSLSRYRAGDGKYDLITQYLYMSYNGLHHADDYAEELFLPVKTAEAEA